MEQKVFHFQPLTAKLSFSTLFACKTKVRSHRITWTVSFLVCSNRDIVVVVLLRYRFDARLDINMVYSIYKKKYERLYPTMRITCYMSPLPEYRKLCIFCILIPFQGTTGYFKAICTATICFSVVHK